MEVIVEGAVPEELNDGSPGSASKSTWSDKKGEIRSEKVKFLMRASIYTLLTCLFFIASFGFFVFIVPIVQELPFAFQKQTTNTVPVEDNDQIAYIKKIHKDIAKLKNKVNTLVPKSSYLVINTTENKFKLYKRSELVREGKCSTGSYINLVKDDRQAWIFKTPKGVYPIRGKTTSPVWIKPDWAFIEEGMPVPSATHPSRYESGVLGDYALSLGHGYMIHGTLYQRFLGMAVTHGCVRLNDDDLNSVYHTLDIGSKVFIY